MQQLNDILLLNHYGNMRRVKNIIISEGKQLGKQNMGTTKYEKLIFKLRVIKP